MPPAVLVICHDHVTTAGLLTEPFRELGWVVHEMLVVPRERADDPGVSVDFPALDGYAAVVLMGYAGAVYDDGIAVWVEPELDLVREADARGIPVLGVCFGAQLLAVAHGGTVAPSPAPELGWAVVHTDDAALVAPGPWLQWHFDRFTVPPGATEVARNASAAQAFSLRRNLGVQFHPEAVGETIRLWLETGGYAECAGLGLDGAVLLAHTTALEGESAARARQLVLAFLDRAAFGEVADQAADQVTAQVTEHVAEQVARGV